MKFISTRAVYILILLASVSLAPSLRVSAEGDDLRAADADLNRTYQKALDAMPDSETKGKLREAQRAWIGFRDAELALKESLPGASGNTLKMLQTDLTETRTKQLKELTES